MITGEILVEIPTHVGTIYLPICCYSLSFSMQFSNFRLETFLQDKNDILKIKNCHSAVSIATEYGLDYLGVRFRVPVG
jgi:hypothetical protein